MNIVEAMNGFIIFTIGLLIVVGVWIGISKFINEVMKDTKLEAYAEKCMGRIAGLFGRGK